MWMWASLALQVPAVAPLALGKERSVYGFRFEPARRTGVWMDPFPGR